MRGRTGYRWDLRSVVWAVAILAISAGFFLLVAGPQSGQARTLVATVQNEQAELAARCHSIEAIARSEKEAAAVAARAADFDQHIPAQPMVGNFLEDLARVAQNRNLRSETIQPGEAIQLSGVTALPIAIKLVGPFSGVHGLLRDIERMPRLTRIEQFKATADDAPTGAVTVEMELRIFYRKPVQEATTG